MKNLGLFPKNININFVKYHKICFLFSFILIIICIVYMFVKGLNLGTDFKGGIVIILEPKNINEYNISLIKKDILSIKFLSPDFKEFSNSNILQVTINEKTLNNFKNNVTPLDLIRKTIGDKVNFIKTEFIGPNVSKQLIKDGSISLILALLGIFVYVWFRFDWQYSTIGILTLIHDSIIAIGILTLFNYEINISTIAAVLTVIGYSINDTIITFNQVKENIKRYPDLSDTNLLNRSLNDVISRTISTSLTVILVLISVYLFGGTTLKSFSFTLLIGVIFGTYSSVYLAVPALLYTRGFRSIKNINKKA